MIGQLNIREMESGEEQSVSDLIRTVFNKFVATDFSDEGINVFMNFIEAECIKERHESGSYIVLAIMDGVVGALEILDKDHIALFFVDEKYHGRGIAKKLLHTALMEVKAIKPEITKITVHSSLYAIPVYEKLGFQVTDKVQITDGIKYVPMTKLL